MPDGLDTSEIKKRGISGAKWLIIMNGVGAIAAFGIAIILGRVGPEILGVFGLAQILINVITTFVLYGGPPVLPVFLPKLSNAEERGRFFSSYLLVLLVMAVLVLGFFRLCPGAFEFLLQRKFEMGNYSWFVLLALVIVSAETLSNTASGLMQIKAAAIGQQLMRLAILPLVVFLFFFKREVLIEHSLITILGGFFIGYLLAATVCGSAIAREPRFKMRLGWLLPKGFWPFSISMMSVTIFTFLYGTFDRMVVLSINDVVGLGMYQAVISINMLEERMPTILLPSVIPTFSNLLGANHLEAFKRAFTLLCRWAVVPLVLIALVIISFSHQILGLFGEAYVDYAYILSLFAFARIIRSMSLPTLVIITCLEKNKFQFFRPFFQTIAQIILTFLFLSSHGILAVVGAKILTSAIASYVGVYYVINRLKMAPKTPLSYKVGIVTGVVVLILRLWVVPTGWVASSALALAGILAFLGFSRFTWIEVLALLRFITRHDVGTLLKMAEKD